MLTRRFFLGSVAFLPWSGRLLGASAPGSALASDLVRAGFRGTVLTPDKDAYAAARRVFVTNPKRTAHPQIIAMCSGEDDVRSALAFARRASLPFSVRAGGHDLLAASMCDGMVIDLSPLQQISVDAARRSVRLGTGMRSGKLNTTLGERQLAAALGCASQVGVSGLTLGGGLGWFAGKFGAACDHLLAARVVMGDGRVVLADANRNSELLWALRGGGGNFGIVTEMTLRCHSLPPVISGIVALRGRDFAGFFRRYRDYLDQAGEEVDFETYVLPTLEGPMIFIKACYSGGGNAERVLGPLRKLGEFVADDLGARPYTGSVDPTAAVAPHFRNAPVERRADDVPGLHVRSASMAPFDDAAADILADQVARARGNWAVGLAHRIHGAAARPGPGHSPMPRIQGLLTTYFLTTWRREADARPAMAWVDQTAARLRPYAEPTYLNYLTDEAPSAVRDAYGPSFNRLRRVKRRFDPDNIFNRGRPIPPA